MSNKFLLKYGKPNIHYDVDKFVYSDDLNDRTNIAGNHALSDKHIDYLINDVSPMVRILLSKNPRLKPHHIDHILKNKYSYPNEIYNVINHHVLTDEQIDYIIDNHNPDYRKSVAEMDNLKPHQIDKLVNDEDRTVRKTIALHNRLTDDHIDKLIDDHSFHVRRNLAMNYNLKEKHILQLRRDNDPDVTRAIHQYHGYKDYI